MWIALNTANARIMARRIIRSCVRPQKRLRDERAAAAANPALGSGSFARPKTVRRQWRQNMARDLFPAELISSWSAPRSRVSDRRAGARPLVKSRDFSYLARGFRPPKTIFAAEGRQRREPAVLVLLQADAPAPAHLAHLAQWEDQEPAIVAERRRRNRLPQAQSRKLSRPRLELRICLPLRVWATTSSSSTTKPLPVFEATSSFRPGLWTNSASTSLSSSRSIIRRIGSPCPRPPGRAAGSRV